MVPHYLLRPAYTGSICETGEAGGAHGASTNHSYQGPIRDYQGPIRDYLWVGSLGTLDLRERVLATIVKEALQRPHAKVCFKSPEPKLFSTTRRLLVPESQRCVEPNA